MTKKKTKGPVTINRSTVVHKLARSKGPPKTPASPYAHRTTGYSMPDYVHVAVDSVAAAHGINNGSLIAKLFVVAHPAAVAGYKPFVPKRRTGLRGKQASPTKTSKKRTVTLDARLDVLLVAYAAQLSITPSRTIELLIEQGKGLIEQGKAALLCERKKAGP